MPLSALRDATVRDTAVHYNAMMSCVSDRSAVGEDLGMTGVEHPSMAPSAHGSTAQRGYWRALRNLGANWLWHMQ
jgi:hypothetical protein